MEKENDIVIEVKDVKKKFKIYYDKGNMLKERILFRSRNRYEEKNVLNGISFSVRKGETVGLIGHNGCGKSTTLKLLTQIMYPDSGKVNIYGRVSSLLELGAGFHPDMSGRENIYTNASIFGLSKKEIDKRLDLIIEFSELEPFIDNPVRTYSSGMYMRLAFSVAINVDADILLIDEILAVGDVNFQAKCMNKLMEIRRKGTTIVIVSHSMAQIEQLCDRSIWIHEGLIVKDGPAHEVDNMYLDFMDQELKKSRTKALEEELAKKLEQEAAIMQESAAEETAEAVEQEVTEQEAVTEEVKVQVAEKPEETDPEAEMRNRRGTGEVRITSIIPKDENGNPSVLFNCGDTIEFQINFKVYEPIDGAGFGFSVSRIDGQNCFATNSKVDEVEGFRVDKNGSISIKVKNVLLPGRYYVDSSIMSATEPVVDFASFMCEFDVCGGILGETGIVHLDREWFVQ